MLTSYFISPHPLLQPFVDNYMLCTSHSEKIQFNNTWPASSETTLVFYLSDRPNHYTSENISSPLQHINGCIIGLQSRCNGMVYFYGDYHTFMIQFKANGYYKLFEFPAGELLNNLFYLDDVFGKKAKELNEALQNAKDIQQMSQFADSFLLHFLNRQKKSFNVHDGITYISNEILKNNSLLNIEQYACKANMSVRNFGRRFTEQVGVSPKLYCRLLRFNKAMFEKIKQPATSWTSIAYNCGYYDQMHLIKDFKEFADVNPSEIFKPRKDMADQKNNESFSANKRLSEEDNLHKEQLVFVKRNNF